MSSTIIVSNRLPYTYDTASGTIKRSAGGLATALGPLFEHGRGKWVGMWDPAGSDAQSYERMLREQGCVPVKLTAKERKGYYDGFSNSTLWPLFHGFMQFASFDEATWEMYQRVNRKFCDAVLLVASPGDTIWVQDYQLMLLPALLREKLPDASIGFFLHIPFPSYETFRVLPQRQEVLEGMLGADLIGFHTYDYVRHFLSSITRILGVENRRGLIWRGARMVLADVFPLGVDYEKFARVGREADACRSPIDEAGDMKCMLSVERMDYTKGIPSRLRAYEEFLKRYPEWRGRVTLDVVSVPSREGVASYRRLKERVDQLVGRINGLYATATWQPIRYFYRSLPFDELVERYRCSDVMLVTPLRDGMNLVAKEYLAAREGRGGVLILSEMAGAARELGDAIVVNPFDKNALVEAMHEALTMPELEQRRRNALMQKRLRRYTSERWAQSFLQALHKVKKQQGESGTQVVDGLVGDEIRNAYHAASRRVMLLDYDGTLVPFSANPASVQPDEQLQRLLARLSRSRRNTVVIISGRDRATMESWFSDLGVDMVAEHGVWKWEHESGTWVKRVEANGLWKEHIRPILEAYVDSTPGSFLEEKEYSLVWHYRTCSAELAERRIVEMRMSLSGLVESLGLQMMEGNKIVEVRLSGVDKGTAALAWLADDSYDFSLVAGDDATDEDMFRIAPSETWSVKVGGEATSAAYCIKSCTELRRLLASLDTDGA